MPDGKPVENVEVLFSALSKLAGRTFQKLSGKPQGEALAYPLPSGALRFEFWRPAAPQQRFTADWGDEFLPPEEEGKLNWRERVSSSGNDEALTAMAVNAVEQTCDRIHNDSRFNILRFANRSDSTFTLDNDAMNKIIAQRLSPDSTACAGFVFKRAEEKSGAFYKLVFEHPSQGKSVSFLLTPSQEASEQPVLGKVGPLDLSIKYEAPAMPAVYLESTDRNSPELPPRFLIHFVCFLLARSLHERMELVIPPRNRTLMGDSGAGEKLDIDRAPVSCGNPMPQTAWRRFLTPYEIERDAICNIQFTGRSTSILHGELECLFIQPTGKDRVRFHKPLWRLADEKSLGSFSTNLGDQDVIYGGNEKLSALLDIIKNDHIERDTILLNDTCVARIIGDDISQIKRDHHSAGGTPILHFNIGLPSPTEILADLVKQIKTLALEKENGRYPDEKLKSTIVLAGYPVDKSLNEVVQLLTGLEIIVSAMPIPQLGVDQLRIAMRAELVVSTPAQAWYKIAEELIAPPGTKTIAPDMPYGLSRTWRWLREIAESLGKIDLFESRFGRQEPEIPTDLLAQTSSCKLGFILDMEEMERLTDSKANFGIPTLPFLEELGFLQRLYLYTTNPTVDVPKSEERLASVVKEPPRIAVKAFRSAEELSALLGDPDGAQAVYSQFSLDRRLYRSGKSAFSIIDFEKGFEGAVRTAKRLLSRCRWSGPAQFGAYVRAKGWPS